MNIDVLPQALGTGASPTFVGLTLTGLTAGRVVYVGASDVLADEAGFEYDAASNFFGVGGGTPTATMDAVTEASSNIRLTNYAASSVGANFVGRKARGSLAAPRRAQTSDVLGGINFFGAQAADDVTDATFVAAAAQFRFVAEESYTSTARGARWELRLTPAGTATIGDPLRVTSAFVMKIAGTAVRGTTEGTNHLDIFDGTAPAGTLANGVSLYSASGECWVIDAGGTATQLSPHDRETREWIFNSVDTRKGTRLRIDVERLLRTLNDKYGLDCIHEEAA